MKLKSRLLALMAMMIALVVLAPATALAAQGDQATAPLSLQGGSVEIDGALSGASSDNTVRVGEFLAVNLDDLESCMSGFKALYEAGKATASWCVADDASFTNSKATAMSFTEAGDAVLIIGKKLKGKYVYLLTESSEDTWYNNNTRCIKVIGAGGSQSSDPKVVFSIDKSNADIFVIKGKIENAGTLKFTNIYIGDQRVGGGNGTTFTQKVYTKYYDIGKQTLTAYLNDGSEWAYDFEIGINEKPALAAAQFKSYPTTIEFTAGTVPPSYDGLGIAYKKKGDKKWKTSNAKSLLSSGDFRKLTKLSPGAQYLVKTFYAKKSGGKLVKGAFSKTLTIKTGPKGALPVASVKAENVNAERVYISGHWNKGTWVEGFYATKTTYTLKIAMKEKPGCLGLVVDGEKLAGNETAYTKTCTVSGDARGSSVKVRLYSYGNKEYGAYSKTYTTTVKL